MQIKMKRARPACIGWEWLYRLPKNSEGKSRWWAEFLSKEGGRRCFILASDKNKKDQKIDYCPKQDDHKAMPLKHETNKTDRKPPITNHKRGPFELVQVNMCFLRGPLRGLTGQKNPKFLRILQNAQRDTTNFTVWLNNSKTVEAVANLV